METFRYDTLTDNGFRVVILLPGKYQDEGIFQS
jgi:hypothetical protein